MSKTIAEIRAAKRVARPERTLTICLAPDLVAEVQALVEELETLDISDQLDSDGRPEGPPSRMGDGDDPRADEIRARLREALAEMSEWEGELRLRAVEDGQWRRWVNEHPARAEGEVGYVTDIEVARGYCNADDLLDELGPYAFAWDGEPLAEGDWDTIAASVARPDKKRIATAVVAMHEQVMDIPKWGRTLSATLGRWPVGEQPEPPESPPASTSAESQQSATSTTTPTET